MKVIVAFTVSRYITCVRSFSPLSSSSSPSRLALATAGRHRRLFSSSIFSGKGDDVVGMEQQWQYWPYFEENIKWHSDWLRLDAETGDVKEHFRGIRHFQASSNKEDDEEEKTVHHNTYMYGDERGTVSEGPLCGPWTMTKRDCSSEYGMIHTARPFMRTLMGPDRSAVWLFKELPEPGTSPCGFELFLGDGKYLRLSVGIVYDPTGKLIQLSAIREDSRGFEEGYWNPTDESMTVLDSVPKEFVDDILLLSSSSQQQQRLEVSVPGPVQTITTVTTTNDDKNKFLNIKDGVDTIFELPDEIYVVCPRHLPTTNGVGLWVAAGWKKKDGTLTCTVEAKYDDQNHMEQMIHTKIA